MTATGEFSSLVLVSAPIPESASESSESAVIPRAAAVKKRIALDFGVYPSSDARAEPISNVVDINAKAEVSGLILKMVSAATISRLARGKSLLPPWATSNCGALSAGADSLSTGVRSEPLMKP